MLVLPTEPVTLAIRGLAAPAAGAAEVDQRLHGVGHADQRAARGLDIARDHGGRGAALQRLGDEAVAVGGLAAQREEQVALGDGAAVEGDAVRLERRGDRRRRQGARHLVGGPERAHVTASGELARDFRIVEGMRHALDRLAGLVALAGDQQQVVLAAERRHALLDGGVPAVAHFDPVLPVGRNAAHDLGADRRRLLAARIVVGDEREVGEARGDLAHHRPLAAIAIAAAAEHHDQLAAGEGPQGRQHGLERLGLVGVVDIDRRRPSGDGRRAAGGRARRSRSPGPATARAGSPPVATTRPRAPSALEAWKPPTSGSSIS